VIVGIGVDIVDLARFARVLQRTPKLAARLFTQGERGGAPQSIAATFAAKEAVAKALGAPPGLAWHDVEVSRDDRGRPSLVVRGTVALAAQQQGVTRWHVSLSHDAGSAVAVVVAEAGP
jgi:holo-[acyl-carrier protein] synthase